MNPEELAKGQQKYSEMVRERERAANIPVNTSEEFKPPAVVINEQLVQKVQDTAAKKLREQKSLSFDDIANVLNIKRMEGQSFYPTKTVKMISPEFGIFTGDKSIIAANELSRYMEAGYIPSAAANSSFLTVPILPFAVSKKKGEILSTLLEAYASSKSAGMASTPFFVSLNNLKYKPELFSGQNTEDVIEDIKKLREGIEIDRILTPNSFFDRLTGSRRSVSHIDIAGSSEGKLIVSSGYYLNRGVAPHEASSIKARLTGYTYLNKSGNISFIDANRITGKYEFTEDYMPVFEISATLNDGTKIEPYTIDVRQIYEENAKILRGFVEHSKEETQKVSSDSIIEAVESKSRRLPEAMFASRIKKSGKAASTLTAEDYFIDIETTPAISGKSFITQFGYVTGTEEESVNLFTKFSFAGEASVEKTAALTSRFGQREIDISTRRMLDIIRQNKTGDDILESADELSEIISPAKRIIGYNIKKFDIPYLDSAGVSMKNAEIFDLFEFVSGNKKIIESYFGVNFKDDLTLENVYNVLRKSGKVADIAGKAHSAGFDVMMTREVYRSMTPIIESFKTDPVFQNIEEFQKLSMLSVFSKIVKSNKDVLGEERAGKYLSAEYKTVEELSAAFKEVLEFGTESSNIRSRIISNPWQYSGGSITSIDYFDLADQTGGARVNLSSKSQVVDIIEAVKSGNNTLKNVVLNGIKGNITITQDNAAIFSPTKGIKFSDVADVSFGSDTGKQRVLESIKDVIRYRISRSKPYEQTEEGTKKIIRDFVSTITGGPQRLNYEKMIDEVMTGKSTSDIVDSDLFSSLYNDIFSFIARGKDKLRGVAEDVYDAMRDEFTDTIRERLSGNDLLLKNEGIRMVRSNKVKLGDDLADRIKQEIIDMESGKSDLASEIEKLHDPEVQERFIQKILNTEEVINLQDERYSKIANYLNATVLFKSKVVPKAKDMAGASQTYSDMFEDLVDMVAKYARSIKESGLSPKEYTDFQRDILATIVTGKTREYIRDLLLRRFRGTEEDMIDFPEEFKEITEDWFKQEDFEDSSGSNFTIKTKKVINPKYNEKASLEDIERIRKEIQEVSEKGGEIAPYRIKKLESEIKKIQESKYISVSGESKISNLYDLLREELIDRVVGTGEREIDKFEGQILSEFGEESDVAESLIERADEMAGSESEISKIFIPQAEYVIDDEYINRFLSSKLMEENINFDETNFSQYFKAFKQFFDAEISMEAARMKKYNNLSPEAAYEKIMASEYQKRNVAQSAWSDVRLYVAKRQGNSILEAADAPNIFALITTRKLIDRQKLIDSLYIREEGIDLGGKTRELFDKLSQEEKGEIFRILDIAGYESMNRSEEDIADIVTKSADASGKLEHYMEQMEFVDDTKRTIQGKSDNFSEMVFELKKQLDFISGRSVDMEQDKYIDALSRISLHVSENHLSYNAFDAAEDIEGKSREAFEDSIRGYSNIDVDSLIEETIRDIYYYEDIEPEMEDLTKSGVPDINRAKLYAGIDSIEVNGNVNKWSMNDETFRLLRAGAVVTMKNNKKYTVEKVVRGIPVLIDESGKRVAFDFQTRHSAFSLLSDLLKYEKEKLSSMDREAISAANEAILKIGIGGRSIDKAASDIYGTSERMVYASREILDFLNRDFEMSADRFRYFAEQYAYILEGRGISGNRAEVARYIAENANEVFEQISKDPSRIRTITEKVESFAHSEPVYPRELIPPSLKQIYGTDINKLVDYSFNVDIAVGLSTKSDVTRKFMSDYVYKSLKPGVESRFLTDATIYDSLAEGSRLKTAMESSGMDVNQAAIKLLEEDKEVIDVISELGDDFRKIGNLISSYNKAGGETSRKILISAAKFYQQNRTADFETINRMAIRAINSGGFAESIYSSDASNLVVRALSGDAEAIELVTWLEKNPEKANTSIEYMDKVYRIKSGNRIIEEQAVRSDVNISDIIRSKKVVEKVISDMQLSVEEASKFSSYFYSLYGGTGERAIDTSDAFDSLDKIKDIYIKDAQFLEMVKTIDGVNLQKVENMLRSYNYGTVKKEAAESFMDYVKENITRLNKNNMDYLVGKVYSLSQGDIAENIKEALSKMESVYKPANAQEAMKMIYNIATLVSNREHTPMGDFEKLFSESFGRNNLDEFLKPLTDMGIDIDSLKKLLGAEGVAPEKIFKETQKAHSKAKLLKEFPNIGTGLVKSLPAIGITSAFIGLFVAIGAKARAEAKKVEEEMRNTQMVNTLSSVNLIANGMRYSPSEPEISATMSVNGQEDMDASSSIMSGLGIRNGYITYRS